MNINLKLNSPILLPALASGTVLSVPLIAMQFTDEVVWSLSDFIIAGLLLFSTIFTYKLITQQKNQIVYRLAVGFTLFAVLFLTWINLAVGIIGSENNPGNWMYSAVIVVIIIGAIFTRFQSFGMSLTMFLAAFTQILVTAITLLSGIHHLPGSSVLELLGINGLFVTLFVLSAFLFRYDAYNK